MAVNDDAGYLDARGVLASIASRLAPTRRVINVRLPADPDFLL